MWLKFIFWKKIEAIHKIRSNMTHFLLPSCLSCSYSLWRFSWLNWNNTVALLLKWMKSSETLVSRTPLQTFHPKWWRNKLSRQHALHYSICQCTNLMLFCFTLNSVEFCNQSDLHWPWSIWKESLTYWSHLHSVINWLLALGQSVNQYMFNSA